MLAYRRNDSVFYPKNAWLFCLFKHLVDLRRGQQTPFKLILDAETGCLSEQLLKTSANSQICTGKSVHEATYISQYYKSMKFDSKMECNSCKLHEANVYLLSHVGPSRTSSYKFAAALLHCIISLGSLYYVSGKTVQPILHGHKKTFGLIEDGTKACVHQ